MNLDMIGATVAVYVILYTAFVLIRTAVVIRRKNIENQK